MKKGFITIYLLPIFLSLMFISVQVVQSITSSHGLTNNYLGKQKAEYLADIGLKHGIKVSKEEIVAKGYYINLINDNIELSEYFEGSEYTKVTIRVKSSDESITIGVESISNVGSYSHKLNHHYTIDIESEENNVDNSHENLDTKKNGNLT
ncbi:hypothetical protein [Clostridium cylindrosporum]|uniref:Uncharacterized protein n=1 Tax=Clostridium cylindrosporum DSM 605 TaxID=1121307 RepID=A0A0J8DAK2_CLOCY|nr:hypothetical protein [Clostridium cylindrosporum]KMT21333.1 hypothetical protein CLCY_2c00930 [Clostridium cylindrosporum DSM 605]